MLTLHYEMQYFKNVNTMQRLYAFQKNSSAERQWIHFYWLAIKLWKMLGYFTQPIVTVSIYSTQG